MDRTEAPDLPPDFVFGVATSSYQVEGAADEDGRSPSVWDTFSRTPGNVFHGDTGDVTADHYHRLEEDLDLLARLGVDAYRFSVAWSRVLPDGRTAINHKGLDFYRRLVDGLLSRGIDPALTIYHWDHPQALEDELGGWPHRDMVGRFADYTGVLADALGDRVRYWMTVNEPVCPTFNAYGLGLFAPGRREPDAAFAAAHHLLLAHGAAVDVLRAAAPTAADGTPAPVGIPINPVVAEAATPGPEDTAALRRHLDLHSHWFTDPLLRGAYPVEQLEFHRRHGDSDFGFVRDGDLARISRPLDFLGLNYYSVQTVSAAEPPADGERTMFDIGTRAEHRPDTGLTDFGWSVRPDGLALALRALRERYPGHPPVYVTENGCAYADYVTPDGRVHDPERTAFLRGHLAVLAEEIRSGADVRGYFQWSLLDNFEWAAGFSKRFGLVHVDYASGKRTRKDSFEAYREIVAAVRGLEVTA